jgi:hypothetical protein
MNNSKLFMSAICVLGLTLAAPLSTEAGRHGGGRGGGSHFAAAPRGGSFARPGMRSYGARWNGANWSRTGASNRNWSGAHWNSAGGHWTNHNGRWGWWNGHRWYYPRRNVVFIGSFGFPWWWGWGWGPWAGWGWGWGYPYGYYGYGYPYYGGYAYPYYGYGNGYGAEYQYGQYGNSSQSRVAELQRRLQRAGYYHGSVDGIMGPKTRSAIRAYEQDHGDVG